jgi:hypothetical protein
MDYAVHFADQAQRWHETDHGLDRGRPLRRSRFIEPVEDDDYEAPKCFRACEKCDPAAGRTERNNPFWYRVKSWEQR